MQFLERQFTVPGFEPGALDPRQILRQINADERFRLFWRLPLQPDAISPDEVGTTYPGLLTWLVRQYGRSQGKEMAQVWVDQTPVNFRRVLTLLRLFPEARFIHLVRDGRAVAASLLALDWGPNDTFLAAEYWMARCAAGLAAETQLGPERVLRVRYEDILEQPESTLRRIATYAGLNFEPGMLQGVGLEAGPYHKRQHRLVGAPPDRTRADAWRTSLSPRQVEIFEAQAGDFLSLLGYEPVLGIRARPANRVQIFQLRLSDLVRRIGNNLRRWRRAWEARFP
jgi:hypothetical protein